jgi:DNA-binding NtrC family response regulator
MKIFVVEDDEWFSKIIEYHLSLNPDYEVTIFRNGKEALRNLHLGPDVIVIDYNLPDIKGDELIKRVKREKPEVYCVIVSVQEDVEIAINLLKEGAFDYIVKNDETKERLWLTMTKINNLRELTEEIATLQQEVKKKYDFSNIIKGNSKGIQRIFKLIEKASSSNITVSVTGETGTGKELVAKAVHFNSDRNKKSFVAVNVAAIPKELIESELFGHEKGAFTGADRRRIGKFEESNKGTIFLDEIGEMDLTMQTKLLRVLQEKEVTRVGGNTPVKLDLRVVIATHKNLLEEVQEGRFREDLYYRLYGLPIELPPLRDRGNDILILAKYFADEYCKENKINKKTFSSSAQEKLMSYHFPGNIRELKGAIDLSALMSDGNEIEGGDINFLSASSSSSILKKEMTLREYEATIIQHFLDKYNKNVLQVAKKLDIGKSTIYRMIKNKELII